MRRFLRRALDFSHPEVFALRVELFVPVEEVFLSRVEWPVFPAFWFPVQRVSVLAKVFALRAQAFLLRAKPF